MPTHDVESEIKEAGEDLEKLRKLVREKDSKITQQNEAISNLTGLYEKEREKNKKLQEEINRLKDELAKCREAKEKLEKELEKCQKDKESNKKCQEELEKCKKRQEELENELKKCQEDKEELEKNNKKNKWLAGEYKWMPVGSQMPEGWVKVKLEQGYTLVQNNEEGTTQGEVGKHSHFFQYQIYSWAIKKEGTLRYSGINMQNPNKSKIFPNVEKISDATLSEKTSNSGDFLDSNNKNNLGAGLYAELWQYQGK